MSDRTRKFPAKFVYCEFKESYDGKARIDLTLVREMEKKAAGSQERFEIRITIDRSDLCGLVLAVREFMKRERAAVDEIDAYVGRSDE